MDPRDEAIDIDEPPHGALTTQPRANQIARQDFSGSSLAATSGATEALVAKARATVEASVIAAKRWPRNMLDARDRVLRECRRPDFAATAMYSVPRGAGRVEGLSIRFAEMALRSMGNMEATSETIYDDATSRMIRVRVVDYESMAAVAVDFTVGKTKETKELRKGQRPIAERVNSQGQRLFIVEATDDDVIVKQNAQVSKAMRTGILRLVPGDIQDEAKAIIRKTASDKNAKDPAAAQKRMLAAYAAIGVKPSAIETWLGHSIDTVTQEELTELEGLFAAIREQETTWHESIAAVLAERDGAKHPAVPTKPPAAPQSAPPAAPAPRQSEASMPSAEPQREAAPARQRSSGKGTAALKGALTGTGKSPPAPPSAPKPDPAPTTIPRPADDDEDSEAEPAWMGRPEVPPDEPPPRPGYEDRACARCHAVMEVPVTDPPGGICYACSQA